MLDQRSAFFGYTLRMLHEMQRDGELNFEREAYKTVLNMCKLYKMEPIDKKDFENLVAFFDYIDTISGKVVKERIENGKFKEVP